MNAKVSVLFFLFLLCSLPTAFAAGEHGDTFQHPIKTGEQYTQASHCPNCGMNINMWARTRHQFDIGSTSFETCSMRCMADTALKAGEAPSMVQAAVYLEPQTMGEATKGWYVMGSKAPGTMTPQSKIFFTSKPQAEQFIRSHGGSLAQLDTALSQAQAELQPMREKLQHKRLKKGKIALPDDTTSCANCGMRPAQYPAFRSQMNVQGKDPVHFCSTKCLLKQKDALTEKGAAAWVTVYPDGDTEFAEGLYYVIGSDMMGPMGPDALPFRKKHDAMEFIKQHGGMIKTYAELTPSLLSSPMHHKMH